MYITFGKFLVWYNGKRYNTIIFPCHISRISTRGRQAIHIENICMHCYGAIWCILNIFYHRLPCYKNICNIALEPTPWSGHVANGSYRNMIYLVCSSIENLADQNPLIPACITFQLKGHPNTRIDGGCELTLGRVAVVPAKRPHAIYPLHIQSSPDAYSALTQRTGTVLPTKGRHGVYPLHITLVLTEHVHSLTGHYP